MTTLPLFDSPSPEPPAPNPESAVPTSDPRVSRPEPRVRVVASASAAERRAVALDLLRACAPGARTLIVGASRGAADDLAREAAAHVPATFGIERLSFTQLAARTALVALAGRGASPSTGLGAEAVATRAAFDAIRDGGLRYFRPVADLPGFPRALAHTLQELRLAGVPSGSLAPLVPAGADLLMLLERFEASFAAARAVDRADLFRTAAAALRNARRPGDRPAYDTVIVLDVALVHEAERECAVALAGSATEMLATVPDGDRATMRHLESLGGVVHEIASVVTGDLASVGRFLFDADRQPPARDLDGSLELFSAPGEGRESVEIVRRVLKEARGGVRFDEMAIVVRSPQSYFGLLEHALHRANVPAWFDRGTRRPHPAGRAFLALLTCAADQLSAARFAEYLSLGQVPDVGGPAGDGRRVSDVESGSAPHALPADEAYWVSDTAVAADGGRSGSGTEGADDADGDDAGDSAEPDAGLDADPDAVVVAGTLRAPWKWEALLVDAAVIGQDASRWRRRLAGKAAELDGQAREAEREDGTESGRVQRLRRMRAQLASLETFALPIVEELSKWPPAAVWGDWLDRFSRLAPRVLRAPERVLRVLADLRPMSGVGPIDLDEARRVLGERLLTLESDPPARRFGRVFVGTPEQARGRSFRVVFVPGLAERLFPQRPREDPLLLDGLRERADRVLATQSQRLEAERLLLRIAVGAASDRLYVSYPRIEMSESRARVPSFYALDVMRAATGRIPDYEWLEAQARAAGNATLAWPAPPAPEDAIDEQEHDLAVLRRLLDDTDREAVRGHAHYLLKLNECLRRSVIDRWARGEPRWSVSDGLTRVTDDTAPALAAQRLTARSYSVSALQRFSACPYQFVLGALYRLQPLEQPEPLQRMDPLTRGSLFHEIQARFLRALRDRQALPVTAANLEASAIVLEATVDEVAARAYDELAPAVERVWHDEVAAIRRDLHGWLRLLARDGEEWRPEYFELGFGPVPGERDPRSLHDEVTLPGGFKLRGAIDLVEVHRRTSVLRVTDHKTGRKPDKIERTVVGGGAVLQPVLYAMAVEVALQRPVLQGRLFYCTAAGSYAEHPIPLNDATRAAGLEVLQIIDRAVATGFLAAAPTEDACGRCDYRAVCGPDVFRRIRQKPQDRLADLQALRKIP